MEQSLKDRLVQYGLQRVIQPLEEAEVLFTDTLVLLSMRHIEKIGLSIGLQARLENFIKVIQSSPANVPMSSGDSNEKISGAAQRSQVQDLSDKIAACSSGAQHRPILVQNVQVSSELLNDCNSSSACQNKEPLQRSKKFCRSFLNLNLSEMLEKSIDGRLIVQFYKAKHFLNHGDRKELVLLVSNFLLEQTIELKSVDYLAISKKVVEVFPTETVEAYYIPCSAGVGSQASGKLVARCRNRRASILKAMRSFPSLADGVVDEPAEEDIGLDEMALEIGIKASVELLKSGSELEWNDVLIRWKQTATFRYQEIKEKQQNAASILNEWLPFKHKKGHMLVHHRCVSRDYCINGGLLVVDQTKQCLFQKFCPTDYSKSVIFNSDSKTTEILCTHCLIGETCPKICDGDYVKSMGEITKFEGCEIINGSLTIRIDQNGLSPEVLDSSLFAAFSSLREVTGFIHILKTQIRNLNFLSGLKSIGGTELNQKRYAFLVEHNSKLEFTFTNSQKETRTEQLEVKKGDVLFQSNPRLCPTKIWSFVGNCVGPNITRLPIERFEDLASRNRTLDKDRRIICDIISGYEGGNPADPRSKNGSTTRNCSLDSEAKIEANKHRSFTNMTNGSLGSCNVVNLNVSIKASTNKGSLEIYHQKLDPVASKLSFLIFYKKSKKYLKNLKVEFLSSCLEEWASIGPVFNKTESKEKKEISIPEMIPYSLYDFLVVGFPLNESGSLLKAQSEILQLRAPVNNPSPPVNVEAASKTHSSLEVSWGPPEHPNGIIDHYIVYISRTRIPLANVARNCDFTAVQAQNKFELLRQSLLLKSKSKHKIARSIDNCIESKEIVENFIEKSSVARQPSCFCGGDAAVGENDRTTSRCNATKKLESGVFFNSNFKNDQSNADNMVPFAVPHVVPNYADDEKREKLVYGTNTSFLDLKHSGIYRIEVKACQKPLPCDNFDSIPCSSLKDNQRQSGNGHQQMIQLYKLCSLRHGVGAAVVKGGESRDLHLQVRNNSKEKESGVELIWTTPQDFLSTEAIVYFVEIRNETTRNILRRSYVGPSRELAPQSADIKDLASGHYSARVSVVISDGTLGVTGWVPFYYLDENSWRYIVMIRVLKVVIAVEMLIIALAYFMWRRIRSNRSFGLSDTIIKAEGITERPSHSTMFKEELKIPRDHLEIHTEKKLGSGHFSNVYEATLKTSMGEFVKVAVKIPNQNSMPNCELKKFMKEPAILQNLSSNHIVKLLGVVFDNSSCLFVLEYLANKDLKTFLGEVKKRANSLLPTHTLIRMACEAADGMAYLSSQNLVHRDLAARNCLVSEGNLKISDLGLAGPPEDSNDTIEEVFRYLPVRWMAPESLINGKFTTESDVWSYGVLLWEMSTGGKTPYEEINHEEVAQNVISRGCTLPKPVLSIAQFETVMTKCWYCDPTHRPSFSAIFKYLLEFLEHCGERESLEAVSYCSNQLKLGEESVISLNERKEESFLTWEEREYEPPLGQCPSVMVSCRSEKDKVTPPQNDIINLKGQKEISSSQVCNINSIENFKITTKLSHAHETEPCHSKAISSFYVDELLVQRTGEHPQDTKGISCRHPLVTEPASSSFYKNPPKKKINSGERLHNKLSSRNLSLRLNIGNAKETKEIAKHSMGNKFTERCLSFPNKSSPYELSPFKRLSAACNLSSNSKRRFFNSDDAEYSVNLISPSEPSIPFIVRCEISLPRPAVPFIRANTPFVGSSLPVYYCQCPTECEPTFEQPVPSSPFSENDNHNLICDYPVLYSSHALINLHQKHLRLEDGNQVINSLLTSEYKI